MSINTNVLTKQGLYSIIKAREVNDMNKEQTDLFLEDILEFGKQYVATGAQVKRVEDSMINLCKIYGFEDAEIYAITTLIIATIKNKDGEHFTQSVRVTKSGTDLGRLEEINEVYKYICSAKPDLEEIDRIIKHPKKTKPKPFFKLIGYMLAAGSFAIFFGGNLHDGLAAAVVGIFIYLMDYHFRLKKINNIVYTLTASFFAGALAIISTYFGLGESIDKIMIGDIMLFIPGLLLVNSVQEMFNKDIVAGLYKLIEALFTATAIAGGYALSMILLGGMLK